MYVFYKLSIYIPKYIISIYTCFYAISNEFDSVDMYCTHTCQCVCVCVSTNERARSSKLMNKIYCYIL